MIKNHLLVAFRNIKKRKSFALINVFGLTVGMTVCMLILTYARYEMSYDSFHSRAKDIYRVTVDMYTGGAFQASDAQCYPAAGKMAIEEFPEIEDYAMARNIGRILFKNGETAFNEDRVYIANPGWLKVFDWQMLRGDRESALNEPEMLVLTESSAKKYFGDEDPIGKMMTVVVGESDAVMKVTGVVKDVPENAHLKFDILMSYETGVKYFEWTYDNWNGNNEFMYLLSNGAPLDATFAERYNKSYHDKVDEDTDELLVLQPLTDIHLLSDKTFEADVNGSQASVNILLLVAGFVLVIAWVNYVNLATAKALERGKEVGVRKVLGSSRTSLLVQFLTESFLLNLFSIVLTLTLIQLVLPFFNEFTGISLSFNVLTEPSLLLFVLVLLVIGSLASGIYPALVLSNYQPLAVLSGSFKNSSKGRLLRKGLVVFQFIITVVLLVGTAVIYTQVDQMRKQELGVDIDQTIVVRSPIVAISEDEQELKRLAFKNEVTRLPQVASMAFSETLFGQGTTDMNTTNFYAVGKEELRGVVYYFYRVDADFISTFGFNILAGREFDNNLDKDAVNPKNGIGTVMLLNETARKLMGFQTNEDAIGGKVAGGFNFQFDIVGIFNDYNHHSLKTNVDPTIFIYDANSSSANYTSIKVDIGAGEQSYKSVLNNIEGIYREVYPSSDFDYYFLDEKFNEQYKADQQFGTVFGVFTSITVFVSILGLFGLVLYEVQQRIKEIGIRKVLGADISSIIRMLSTSFMKLILLSIVIALPTTYWGATTWLQRYAYQVELQWYIFVLPAILILLIAFATVAVQAIKVAKRNPIDALRYE
jgi:putative ABC transport system permease protein